MVIEQAIEQQRRLVMKWEARAKDLKETISKHPWDKMGYDFGDWRESELLRRNKQIAESKLIIEVLEKQIPKEPITIKMMLTKRCPVCKCVVEADTEEYAYCQHCGQAIKW